MRKYLVVCLPLLFLIACSSNIDVDGTLMTYEELTSEIETKQNEVQKLDDDLEKRQLEVKNATAELIEIQSDFKNIEVLIEEAEEFDNKKEELQKELSEREKELEELLTNLSDKEKELETISGEIKKKAEEPRVLSAGHFIVGSDLPAGRYLAESVGGMGNFVVWTQYGSLKVNTILGDAQFGELEYIFFAEEGDELELSTRIQFSAVE